MKTPRISQFFFILFCLSFFLATQGQATGVQWSHRDLLRAFGVLEVYDISHSGQEGPSISLTEEPSIQNPSDQIAKPMESKTQIQNQSEKSVPARVAEKRSPSSIKPGDYTIQLSSYETRDSALEKLSELKSREVSAFVTEGLVKGKKWFRVCTGAFADFHQAKAALSEVQQTTANFNAFVTKFTGRP